MKTSTRPAATFVTVVIAASALFGASSAAVPNIAARHMVATSPGTSLDRTAGRRLFAITPAGDVAQSQTARRRLVS